MPDPYSHTPQTRCNGKAALAVGTTTTLTSANAIDYEIKGKMYRKAAATNETTPTTDAVTGAAFTAVGVSKGCVFIACRDAAGALKVVQGQIVDLDASNAYGKMKPLYGPVPDTLCPYSLIDVKVGSTGSAWTFGASNFAGPPTGVVFTFTDIASLPDRL